MLGITGGLVSMDIANRYLLPCEVGEVVVRGDLTRGPDTAFDCLLRITGGLVGFVRVSEPEFELTAVAAHRGRPGRPRSP